MRQFVLLALTMFLAACEPDPSGPLFGDRDINEAPEPAVPKEGEKTAIPSCELKGPVNARKCLDGRGESKDTGNKSSETVVEDQAKLQRQAQLERNKEDCDPYEMDSSPTEFSKFLALYKVDQENFEAWAYCAEWTRKNVLEANAEPYDSPQVPLKSSAPQPGGGCEWKGRNYSPGDSIHYQSDGQILSSDLFVFGENFGNLSGKSGPWQLCECSTSSGHWGCV